jgi:hypothetical protein
MCLVNFGIIKSIIFFQEASSTFCIKKREDGVIQRGYHPGDMRHLTRVEKRPFYQFRFTPKITTSPNSSD